MSYLSLLAGADGIIYYSLFDILKLPDAKERMKFFVDLGNELTNSYKIISSDEKSTNQFDVDGVDGIYSMVKRFEDKDYVILVNTSDEEKKVIVHDRSNGTLKTLSIGPMDAKVLLMSQPS
jgi:hypothetical protein